MPEDPNNTKNDTQAGSNTEPQTNALINPLIDPLSPANDIFGNNFLAPRVARMRIASSPRYRIKANTRQEAAVLMNEIGQCTQMAVRTCYSQKTFTQGAYESMMQNCLTNPKITVVSYGVVEKIDQFGNPWEDWMDGVATMPTTMSTTMPDADPISSEKNPFAGQTIRALTPIESAELERRKKEWENSPYANQSGIDNAVLYAEMPEFERDALAESVRKKLRETYESELENAVTAITMDSNESLKTALWSGADVLTLGLLNLFDPYKAKQLKLVRDKHWLAAAIGDAAGLWIASGASKGFKGAGGAKNPSEIAKSWQGSGKYPGVDKYKDITLKEGKVIYRGEPNGTEYFTTKSAIERSGSDATKIFEGLQVEKNPIHGYRGNMQGYKVTTDIDAAFGITKANPQFGKGGLPQVYVPNVDELIEKGILIPVDNIPLVK